MFKEPTRNNLSYLFDSIYKSAKNLAVMYMISLFNIDEGGIFVIIGMIAISIVVGLISWYQIKFFIDKNSLIYIKGIISKKKLEIPFDKINTFDVGRNLIDRVFQVCTVKIDSGAVKLGQTEINLKVKVEDAEKLRDIILCIKKESINEQEEVNLNIESDISKNEKKLLFERTILIKELVLYAVTKGKLIWSIGAFFIVMEYLEKIIKIAETPFIEKIINYIKFNLEVMSKESIFKLAIVFLAIFAVVYIFVTVLFILYELVRLYKFTIKTDRNNIYISYGLIKFKEYSIPIDKIHALRYKQGLIQQKLGVFNLEAVTIGYGDEEKEKAILYPIANKKLLEDIINKNLPSFKSKLEINKPPIRALSRFIFKEIIQISVIIALTFLVNKDMYINVRLIISLILIFISIAIGYLKYRNTTIGVDSRVLLCSSGGISKVTTIIKQDSIQSVQVINGPFHKIKKVLDFKIDIYTNKISEIVVIKNMDKKLENTINHNLII